MKMALPDLPRADVVRLDGALGIGGDDLADMRQLLGIDRHVHQPDHAFAQQPPARPQDGDAHQPPRESRRAAS